MLAMGPRFAFKNTTFVGLIPFSNTRILPVHRFTRATNRDNLCHFSVGPSLALIASDQSANQPFMESTVTDRPVWVVVVDDSSEVRDLVISMVHSQPELQVVGQACDGEQAVRKIEALRPDLVLLDLGLPTLNGFEVTRIIRKTSPESKIIFVSQESSADVVEEALSLGAHGYVLKLDIASGLMEGVSAVLQGRHFLSKSLAPVDFELVLSNSFSF